MEAIAHSPSFAKKVHIPQSVGKDFATADKGKTFKRGGDMKGDIASKMKMFEKSGKDIEKKGVKEGSKADMALDKKQMMKSGGNVRRMAGGGMGDPFERDTDYEAEKAQGAKNLEGIKGFFGFGKKKNEEAVEETKPSRVQTSSAVAPAPSTNKIEPTKISSTKTDDVQKPTFSGVGSFEDTYEPQRGTKTGSGASGFPSGYKDSGFSALTKTPVKRKPVGVEKVVKKERVITEPVNKTPFK